MNTFEHAGCAGKFKYATANEAMRTAGKSGAKAHHYRCKFCGSWHVGKAFYQKPLQSFRRKKRELCA